MPSWALSFLTHGKPVAVARNDVPSSGYGIMRSRTRTKTVSSATSSTSGGLAQSTDVAHSSVDRGKLRDLPHPRPRSRLARLACAEASSAEGPIPWPLPKSHIEHHVDQQTHPSRVTLLSLWVVKPAQTHSPRSSTRTSRTGFFETVSTGLVVVVGWALGRYESEISVVNNEQRRGVPEAERQSVLTEVRQPFGGTGSSR